MNICLLHDRIPPEGRGGAEGVVWRTALALTSRGHDVSIITTTARPIKGIEEETRDGVRIFSIHSAYHERWRGWLSLYNPATVPHVREALRRIQPEIVHAHNIHFHLSYYSLTLARQTGAKVFLTAHDVMSFHYAKLLEIVDPTDLTNRTEWDYHVSAWQKINRFKWRYNPFRDGIIRRQFQKLDDLFTVSEALRNALYQNGLPKATVLYTGIDPTPWEAPSPVLVDFKKKHELAGRKVILFGGRINATKGGAQLLEALREVVTNVPNVLLLIACSPDEYVERLLATAAEYGIADNVRCTGWLDGEELRAAFHSANVVTVPSICFDSFPLTILEAMSCSKPVIGTCYGGSRESVEEGKTGYIINPFNTETFAERLTELLQNDKQATAFGTAGHVRVKEVFSIERHFNFLESSYSA